MRADITAVIKQSNQIVFSEAKVRQVSATRAILWEKTERTVRSTQ